MKKIRLVYFASFREDSGVAEEAVATEARTIGELYEELAAANRCCVVGRLHGDGLRGAVQRLACRALSGLCGQLGLPDRFDEIGGKGGQVLSKIRPGQIT